MQYAGWHNDDRITIHVRFERCDEKLVQVRETPVGTRLHLVPEAVKSP